MYILILDLVVLREAPTLATPLNLDAKVLVDCFLFNCLARLTHVLNAKVLVDAVCSVCDTDATNLATC